MTHGFVKETPRDYIRAHGGVVAGFHPPCLVTWREERDLAVVCRQICSEVLIIYYRKMYSAWIAFSCMISNASRDGRPYSKGYRVTAVRPRVFDYHLLLCEQLRLALGLSVPKLRIGSSKFLRILQNVFLLHLYLDQNPAYDPLEQCHRRTSCIMPELSKKETCRSQNTPAWPKMAVDVQIATGSNTVTVVMVVCPAKEVRLYVKFLRTDNRR